MKRNDQKIKELKLTSPIPPSINHYTRVRTFIKGGKAFSQVYKTNDARNYQKEFSDYVKKEVIKQNYDLIPNAYRHFYVDCDFYFARIDQDAQNYNKCLLDAITDTQLIWQDDNVVCLRINHIKYDSNNPRIEIVIKPVDYIGIFSNDREKEKFVLDNCSNCSKYGDGACSVYKNAIEGRIQEEIDKKYRCAKIHINSTDV